MKTIKIIDLLIKIKNNEIPSSTKVIFEDKEVYVIDYFYERYKNLITFKNLINFLNEEVEIIEEEKEIEKTLDIELLGQCDNWLQKRDVNIKSEFELNPYIIENIRENNLYFQRKINELIDAVNELRKEK